MRKKNGAAAKDGPATSGPGPLRSEGTQELEPRRTPRQARARKTIDLILGAAAQEIESGGLDRLTTNRIASIAGLSIGAVYSYFPNKESILGALHSRWLNQIAKSIAGFHPQRGGPPDPFAYLRLTMEEIARHYNDNRWVVACSPWLPVVPGLRTLDEKHDEQVLEQLRSALSCYAPNASAADTDTVARNAVLMCHYIFIEVLSVDARKREAMLSYLNTALVAMGVRLISA